MNIRKFLTIARLMIAVICIVVAFSILSMETGDSPTGLGYLAVGIALLCHGKWMIIFKTLRTISAKTVKKVSNRANKVQLETMCHVVVDKKRCGNLADYIMTPTVNNPERPSFLAGRDINLCSEHHPHPDKEKRGSLAHELHAMCEKENISIQTITFLMRYRI